MKRIKRFGVYQTSKVIAIIYFLITVVFMIPIVLISSLVGGENIPGFPFGGGIFFIFLPFIYGTMGFIMTAIGCLIYNLIARQTGGIEFEIDISES